MAWKNGALKVAREFARAVIRRKWAELPPLFASAAPSAHTPESLEAAFGWKHLGPRLRQWHLAQTGETEEMVPDLDPPKRFEVFEVEEREPPLGLDPSLLVGWIEVDFMPAADSEFDVCYNCFLAFIDESGPRVAAYTIESATE